MHLLLPRNVSVNRTLVEALKKYHSNPVETGLRHRQHAECPRRRPNGKAIRAATVTGVPG